MAIVMKKSNKRNNLAIQQVTDEEDQLIGEITKAASTEKSGEPIKKSKKFIFLKRGTIAKQAFDQEEKKAEVARSMPFRFYFDLKKGQTDATVTFLDGDLMDGYFENPFAFEHMVSVAGKWQNFICVHESESCPICETNSKYSYVCYFTVIDHREYKDRQGNVQKNQKRLLVAKRGTVKQLLKMALKRGGLRGCVFDVSRTGENEAAVGNVFDFSDKLTKNQLSAKYGDNATPIEYDKVLSQMYMSGDELRKLGFGVGGVGGEKLPTDHDTGEALEDVSDQL